MSAIPTITGRTVKIGTKSFSSMEEELRQIHQKLLVDEVPKGYFSSLAYAKANGLNDNVAYKICIRATRDGLMEGAMFRVRMNSGAVRSMRHFRIVK